MKKIIERILIIALIVFCIWVFISWIDVCNNNIGNGSNFANWNLFKIIFARWL